MFILVTGASGQLGRSIENFVKKSNINHSFVFVTREELDLSSKSNIKSYFKNHKFDLIINCAAFTAVDRAELYEEEANKINHLAVKQIAEIAKRNSIKLIHISTDFVFDGLTNQPYSETDTTSPLNIYGKSKLAGEDSILSIMKFDAIIIRTSWLYSEYGNNFVTTILKLAEKNSSLNIVSDQIGSPTYAVDLAQVILTIVKSEKFIESNKKSQIYHYSNEGVCNWYDFAKEIINISGVKCTIKPIKTEDYPTAAKRPQYSLLSKKKISKEFNLKINYWQDSLKHCIQNLSNITF